MIFVRWVSYYFEDYEDNSFSIIEQKYVYWDIVKSFLWMLA